MEFETDLTPVYGIRLKNGKYRIENVANPEAVLTGDSVPLSRWQ